MHDAFALLLPVLAAYCLLQLPVDMHASLGQTLRVEEACCLQLEGNLL